MTAEPTFLHDPTRPLDPLGDADRLAESGAKKNFAKVGSGRPSSLLYTYGPGSIMDLPHFTIMPSGLDDWDRIWARRDGTPSIHAPALLEVVRMLLGHQVGEIRPFPRQPTTGVFSREGSDLGVPARVFPQWMRCTGCDRLATVANFEYRNTHPFRTDEAVFEHHPCYGRRGSRATKRGARRQPTVTARYLIACADGHLDEFPYDWWVHEGAKCPAGVDVPALKMIDHAGGRGASATIVCSSCDAKRGMNEAQGEAGRAKLPRCRGRMPHLDGFAGDGCDKEARLMLVGASNLWFPAMASAVVMPRLDPVKQKADLADRIKTVLGDKLERYADAPQVLRDLLEDKIDVTDITDAGLEELATLALAPPESEEERHARRENWDPVDLLVPEWRYLLRDPAGQFHEDSLSGLTLSPRGVAERMPDGVSRILAVDRLRKVNALVGFTRIDDMDRVNDLTSRLVPLTRNNKPAWTVGTEDCGEGIFLQLDEDTVTQWEARVEQSPLWDAHRQAHRRNFYARFSETAANIDPDTRLKPPRYWLMHTFGHVLIRQLAMASGYGAASLSERIYAWRGEDSARPPAAGLLIVTTASDSDGTLGGLVRLSQEDLLAHHVRSALLDATRCSSDPVCGRRTPRDPEEFLHGAACHCCVMASETSCERANRFLDRRFLVDLPGSDLGFFGDPRVWRT